MIVILFTINIAKLKKLVINELENPEEILRIPN